MRTVLSIALLVVGLGCPCLPCLDDLSVAAAEAPADDRSNRTSFYEVPLACPAARGLGCGSAAKPLLLDLEGTSLVDEAWLDQSGMTMAIVWARDATSGDRKTALTAVTEARGVSIEELTGEGRATAAAGFASGKGWHRGADVDRLSEQEALVITDRLLGRLAAKAPSAKAKTAMLRQDMSEAIRQLLVGECASMSECRDKLLAVARRQLDPTEQAALTEAIEAGYRPIGQER
jgi:hypothetical protein